MLYIVFFIAIVIPIALWIWFIRVEDRSEPEPGRLMRQCFYAAITAGFGAGIFEIILFQLIGLPDDALDTLAALPLGLTALTMLLVGPIEELAKYIVLRGSVYFNHEFNQVFDGIVYGITVGLGFAFVENVFYVLHFYTHETTFTFVVLASLRGLISTFAHVTFTGTLGYFVGKAKFAAKGRGWILAQGIIAASLLHATFDFMLAGTNFWGGLLACVLLGLYFMWFIRLWKSPEVRMVWKYVPPPKW